MRSSVFLELQLPFSGGMGYAEIAIYPPKSRFPMENHSFLYTGTWDGNDNSAPAEDLLNKNPSLVALGKHRETQTDPALGPKGRTKAIRAEQEYVCTKGILQNQPN